MKIENPPNSKNSGFSLIELMIVLFVFSLILGGLFASLRTGQQRFDFEQDVLEAQQSARDSMDLMVREIHLAGYPKSGYYNSDNNLAGTTWTMTNLSNRVAVGFVTINSSQIGFEADVDDDGIVDWVEYRLNGTTLERSVVPKSSAATPTSVFKTLAQNVTSLVFTYLDSSNVSTGTAASVKTVNIVLTVRTNRPDPQKKTYRYVTLSSRARALNL